MATRRTSPCETCGAPPDAVDRLREAENNAVEGGSVLEWIGDVVAGRPVPDFAESFPEVRGVMDLRAERDNANNRLHFSHKPRPQLPPSPTSEPLTDKRYRAALATYHWKIGDEWFGDARWTVAARRERVHAATGARAVDTRVEGSAATLTAARAIALAAIEEREALRKGTS